jgi:hypothetical protein
MEGNRNVAVAFPNTSAANVSADLIGGTLVHTSAPESGFTGLVSSAPAASRSPESAFAVPANTAAVADAAPADPRPRFIYGGRDDYRWQLGIGVSFVRFRSNIFFASAVGANTSLAYYTNEWFAIEGSVTTAFAPPVTRNQHVKYLGYGIGPKIAWRQRKWEPWAHAILGGAHIIPQTAAGSQNGYLIEAGGGTDYRLNPRFSLRLEVDWLRTGLFGQTQNSGQGVLGAVFHF